VEVFAEGALLAGPLDEGRILQRMRMDQSALTPSPVQATARLTPRI